MVEPACEYHWAIGYNHCPRRAAGIDLNGKWLCILHLPRGHPAKTLAAFDDALDEDWSRVMRDKVRNAWLIDVRTAASYYKLDKQESEIEVSDLIWDLQGIIFPAHYKRVTFLKKHPTPILAQADMSGMWCWFLNLSGAVFDYADLSHATFNNNDLLGCSFCKAKIRYSNVSGCDFTGASLCGADMTGSNLAGAILNKVTIDDAVLDNVVLTDAQFENVDLGRAKVLNHVKPMRAKRGSWALQSWRTYAHDMLQIRRNYIKFGRQQKADHVYLLEQRAIRKMLWYYTDFHIGLHVRRSFWRRSRDWLFNRSHWFGSLLFDGVALYGNSPGRAFCMSWVVIFLCASLYALAGLDVKRVSDYLFHSVSSFTTLGISGSMITDQTGFWPRIISALEAFAGAAMMALFVFSLGRKALR